MKTKQAAIAALALLGALLLYTLAVYAWLPERMPIHWNIRGEPDGWASKQTAVLMMPGIMLLMLAMMFGLPALSPGQFSMDTFRSTFNYIMLVVTALMGYIHVLMIQAALHAGLDFSRALIAGMLLFFALMGNMLGKVRRNLYMGVKTPWTLANDRVWDATHRLAGRLMAGAGLAGCLLTLMGVSPVLCIVLFAAAAIYPCVYSYTLYKQLEREGKL